MEQIAGNFSDLLYSLVRGSGYKTLKDAVRDMNRNGISVSYPTVAAYGNRSTCPRLNTAVEILNFFGFEASAEQIEDLLQRSRSELKKNISDEKSINAGIRIPVARFNMDKGMLELTIKRRAEELLGEDASLNSYIIELIAMDLGIE